MAVLESVELPIADGFYKSASPAIDSQRCINAYPVITRTPNFERHSLFGTPGLNQISTAGGSQGCRGTIEANGIPYFVVGTDIYKLTRTLSGGAEAFAVTKVGEGIRGGSWVKLAQNGSQIMVVAPNIAGYIYNIAANTFSQVAAEDFGSNGRPVDVIYVDGYFVCATSNKKIISSSLNDGDAWDALDFGSAEADPDEIVALHVHNRNRLIAIGTETSQQFQNVGGADFPFQSVQGATIAKGCYAPFSVVETGGTFIMVGGAENESPAVWAFNGGDYDKISTEGIDNMLSRLSEAELREVTAWAYADSGGYFVGMDLRDTTIVFDSSSGLWHERRTRYYDDNGYPTEGAWRCRFPLRAYGRILAGDRVDGRLAHVDTGYYEEYGGEILRCVITQPFENQGNSFRIPRIEATLESGVGNASEESPQVRISFSKNGVDFGPERSRAVGRVGERNKRQIWKKNGRFNRRAAIKISFSDKVKFSLVKLEAQFA